MKAMQNSTLIRLGYKTVSLGMEPSLIREWNVKCRLHFKRDGMLNTAIINLAKDTEALNSIIAGSHPYMSKHIKRSPDNIVVFSITAEAAEAIDYIKRLTGKTQQQIISFALKMLIVNIELFGQSLVECC